jgi:hypothetical protein
MMKIILAATFASFAISDAYSTQGNITSEKAACAVLKQQAAKVLDQRITGPAKRWFCDVADFGIPDLYVIGLHSGSPCAAGLDSCSNLVDWFAVRRSTAEVYYWDVANLELGKPLPRQ